MGPVIAITHTAAEGTLVYGTARGDGAKDILGPAGFRWYRSIEAWGIVGSRDRHGDAPRLDRVAAQLRAAGFTVTLDIDNTPRSAAEIDAETAARRVARARRLSAKAERGAAVAEQAWNAADAAAERLPPPGEPIKVGHHSEGRHRRAITRAQTVMARAVAAAAKAENDKRRAEAAIAAESHRRSPAAVMNRIERLEAEQRRDEHARNGSRRTLSKTTGAVQECAPAAGRDRDRVVARLAERQEQIDYWKSVHARQVAEGIAQDLTGDCISAGDAIRYRGRWYEVVRVNPKSVTVKTSRGSGSVRYHEITDHRRRDEPPAAPAGQAVARLGTT